MAKRVISTIFPSESIYPAYCDRDRCRQRSDGYGDSEKQRRKDAGRALYVKSPPVKWFSSGSSQDAGDQESGQDKKEVNADPSIAKPTAMHGEDHEDRNSPDPVQAINVMRLLTRRINHICHSFLQGKALHSPVNLALPALKCAGPELTLFHGAPKRFTPA